MFRLFFSIPDARPQFSLSLFLSTALELRKSFLPVWQTRNLTVKILTVCTVVDAVDGDDVVVAVDDVFAISLWEYQTEYDRINKFF